MKTVLSNISSRLPNPSTKGDNVFIEPDRIPNKNCIQSV